MFKTYIRTDSSVKIGTGHVMRCLSLAEELRASGSGVSFVCREYEESLILFIETSGYKVHRLPASISERKEIPLVLEKLEQDTASSWIVVDHYELGKEWEEAVKSPERKILVIDDFEREHVCNIALNQNLSTKSERWNGLLLPKGCVKLLGPEYALLRPKFAGHKKARVREGKLEKALVFWGGSDIDNLSDMSVLALRAMEKNRPEIDVILGKTNPNKQSFYDKFSGEDGVNIFENVTDMASMMASADIFVGASGSIVWECSRMGLPMLIGVIAENQTDIALSLEAYGSAVNMGKAETLTAKKIGAAISYLQKYPDSLKKISKKAYGLVDGRGAEKVKQCMVNYQ